MHDGEVAIFQGVPEALGPVALSQVVERTGVSVDDIASQYVRDRVLQTIHADDRASARTLVDEIVLLEEPPGDAPDGTQPDDGTTAAPATDPSPGTTAPAPASTGAGG